jgi:hypothetical protein
MNTLLIKSFDEGYDAITASDWQFIRTTAARCPQEFGEGVLKARSLWLKYGGGFERSWQDCFPIDETSEGGNMGKMVLESSEDKPFTKPELTELTVYPVPVSELLNLYVPEEYLSGTYQISNIAGVQVAQGQLVSTVQAIPVQDLSNGMHLIQIRVPGKRLVTLKFVVQKL